MFYIYLCIDEANRETNMGISLRRYENMQMFHQEVMFFYFPKILFLRFHANE